MNKTLALQACKIILAFYTISVFSIPNVFSQKDELDKFLEAYKTIEFDESKMIIKDLSFNLDNTFVISEIGTVSGLLFETDIPEIMGYKALVNCKLENKNHQFVENKMLVVMYFNKEKKKWNVYEFRKGADATYEYNTTKSNVEAGNFYTKKAYVYRNLAYWSMMAGKLQDAKKYTELGISEAKSSNDVSFTIDIDMILKLIL